MTLPCDPKRIIIVDDHRIIHHGIGHALDAEDAFTVIARADSGHAAVALAREHLPDLMLMDISMPDLNGMAATRTILTASPEILIVALTMHTERIYVNGMIDAGAKGYVLKSCSYTELLNALRAVLDGNIYISPEVIHQVINPVPEPFLQLSVREKEVLTLIAEGLTTREIAHALALNRKTIENHRHRLKIKLDIHTTAGLTRYAVAKGLVSTLP